MRIIVKNLLLPLCAITNLHLTTNFNILIKSINFNIDLMHKFAKYLPDLFRHNEARALKTS